MSKRASNRLRIESHARRLAEASRATEEATTAMIAELETGEKAPLNAPLNPSSTSPMDLATHRSRHRTGVPSKSEGDPELRAFVVARIHPMTFAEIAGQVAESFPPNRSVALSSLHRWWQKTGQFLPVPAVCPAVSKPDDRQSQDISESKQIPHQTL